MNPDLVRGLYYQVRDQLALRIITRVWPPGSMLPNEMQLAQEMSVSVGTMRKALQLLEDDKLLMRKQGRGTFVLDQSDGALAARFNLIFDDRGQKLDGLPSAIEDQVVAACDEDFKRLGAVEGESVLSIRRLHLGRKGPFLDEETRLLLRQWVGLNESDWRYDRITSLAQRYGVILSHAVEHVTAVTCSAAVAARLAVTVGAPILLLERTVFDKLGRKVEWRSAYLKAEVGSYVTTTS